jgi:hypothetical protein
LKGKGQIPINGLLLPYSWSHHSGKRSGFFNEVELAAFYYCIPSAARFLEKEFLRLIFKVVRRHMSHDWYQRPLIFCARGIGFFVQKGQRY